mmetsp:Transcript_17417/g.31762  ORF Transcript_17417/g.31762 Transcript_17417/m.31762 type:complete len:307 (-) Transcript_17417:12-932(-)
MNSCTAFLSDISDVYSTRSKNLSKSSDGKLQIFSNCISTDVGLMGELFGKLIDHGLCFFYVFTPARHLELRHLIVQIHSINVRTAFITDLVDISTSFANDTSHNGAGKLKRLHNDIPNKFIDHLFSLYHFVSQATYPDLTQTLLRIVSLNLCPTLIADVVDGGTMSSNESFQNRSRKFEIFSHRINSTFASIICDLIIYLINECCSLLNSFGTPTNDNFTKVVTGIFSVDRCPSSLADLPDLGALPPHDSAQQVTGKLKSFSDFAIFTCGIIVELLNNIIDQSLCLLHGFRIASECKLRLVLIHIV